MKHPKTLFVFNRQAEATAVLKSLGQNPNGRTYTDREREACLMNFAANMRSLLGVGKYMVASMALAGGVMAGMSAFKGNVPAAATQGLVAVSCGLFARRQHQQQAFYTGLLEAASNRQLPGARQYLTQQLG